ncbi:hypothetical protein FRX31_014403, partial [Thalictrum thalictroides]
MENEKENGDDESKDTENDERESEEQEKIDTVGSSEGQGRDESNRNVQEAREVHYKGDDASSAV